jgi:bilirubin oxidase
MKRFSLLLAALAFAGSSVAQNPLFIPDTLAGPVYNLNLQTGSVVFFPSYTTPTYGVNGNFLGPTLIMHKWDTVTLNVTNSLPVATTIHWHGMHVPAMADGGPHQEISPGSTWSPSFRVFNDAGTYWYHPHGHGTTELHVTKGIAGMIIVRDSAEAAYVLPRRYGVDDFPLVVQAKAFDVLHQLAAYTMDDSIIMVNGTIDPYLVVPRQVVRFRLLNGSADRSFDFGLSNDSVFYVIGTDGGLLAQPVPLTRLTLSPGERAELLVDFSGYNVNDSLFLRSFGSELPHGMMGADSVGNAQYSLMGYYDNPLNGTDFNIIRFTIGNPTANPITAIPSSFAALNPWSLAQVNQSRTLVFTPDTSIIGPNAIVQGPFFINGKSFDMDSINQVCYLNDVETWTLINQSMVAHPFHIHDIQFYVVDINGNPPPPLYSGKKDVITVMPYDTVRFITRFETYADPMTPYMYHCHLLHHEDEGMMGSFLVIDTVTSVQTIQAGIALGLYPNPSSGKVTADLSGFTEGEPLQLVICNALGEKVYAASVSGRQAIVDASAWAEGVYFISVTGTQQCRGAAFIIRR